MKYDAWTPAIVEQRLLEAMQTSMQLDRVGGPSGAKTGAWLEYSQDYGGIRIKVRPSPGAISRMEESEGWINRWLVEAERKVLRAWLWFKLQRGRTITEYAERSGANSKTLRRFVIRACQRIAGKLNETCQPLKRVAVDELSAPLAHEIADSVAAPRLKRSPRHSREPDAVPVHDPSPAGAKRVEAAIARYNKRLRKMKAKRRPRRAA